MKHLLTGFDNKKIGVVINEFGKQGVDGSLLKREGLLMDEINNGSIFCSCRADQFINSLLKLSKLELDMVFVETSGLADPTGMENLLDTVQKLSKGAYEFKGLITIVDATNFRKLLRTAVVIENQILNSQFILINKTDLVQEKDLIEIESLIKSINQEAKLTRVVFCKIPDNDWLEKNSFKNQEFKTIRKRPMIGSQKILLWIPDHIKKELVIRWVDAFKEKAYRIKGFINLDEGWFYVDGVNGKVTISSSNDVKDTSFLVVLASGKEPIKEVIQKSWDDLFIEKLMIE